MQDSKTPAFSYVRDKDELIYITLGLQMGDALVVALVYYPSATGIKQHIQTNIRYSRVIFDGHADQIAAVRDAVTPDQFQKLTKMCFKRAQTGEEFLLLPTGSIAGIYSSKDSLQFLLADPHLEYERTFVGKALDICRSYQLDDASLGIYGGLQAQLKYLEPIHEKMINDVDITVDGIDNYPKVVQLVAGRGSFIQKYVDRFKDDTFKLKSMPKRWELSCFQLENTMGCDIRIQRLPGDQNSYLDAQSHLQQSPASTVRYESAVVVDARESLTVPVAYKVKTQDGKVLTVASAYYNFVASAGVGDTVNVAGQLVDDEYLLITSSDTDEHYISAV